MSFFEIKNISCIRGNKLLFKNLNFKLNNKDLIVIKGPNGSGKTSCLEVIHLLLTRKSLKTRDLKECIRKDQNSFLELQGIRKKAAV